MVEAFSVIDVNFCNLYLSAALFVWFVYFVVQLVRDFNFTAAP